MKVILASGGSGGHIFPSCALASELEKSGVKDICFVSSKRRLDRNILKDTKYPCFFLSVNPMPRGGNPVRIITFIAKFIADAAVSVYIILKKRPDVIVGFGGYSSGAIVSAAKLLGVPTIIHEQNFLPGRANKILGKIADRIAVSFRGTSEYFPGEAGKVIYSGNPLRLDILTNDRLQSIRKLKLDADKLTVLVMGGSQGSSFLNKTLSEVALLIKEKKGDLVQFIHLTGKKDFEVIKEFYREKNIPGRVFSFLEDIEDAYASSDLAISRAGAAAVFELAYYAKPMILVPYPNPKNNQRSNAIYFSEKGAALYKEETDISRDELAREIIEILTDEEKRNHISEAARNLSVPSAGRQLAEEVISLAKTK